MSPMSQEFRDRLAAALAAHRPTKTTLPGTRAAAVLIPVIGSSDPTVLFTQRTDTLPKHKGQISFPGGAKDDGETLVGAALRETAEEIDLEPTLVDVIGELDTFPTFVSGYTVTPFVGWLPERPVLSPNPAEVAAVLEVPLSSLSDEIRADPGFEHEQRTYPTEAWIWEGNVIWGVTARIVRQFLEVLAEGGVVKRPGGDGGWWYRHEPPRAE